MVMWQLATLGVATEILFLLLPGAFGWTDWRRPVTLTFTILVFGHPLVYFWLLPAYLSWYGMLPAQTDGKMFSEPLARLVFWLFLIFGAGRASPPICRPRYSASLEIHPRPLYLGFAFPSLLTAFTVTASLEIGARARGGKGYFGWVRKLNWGDPSYAAQNLAAILFFLWRHQRNHQCLYNMNMVFHNTTWVPAIFISR